MSSEKPGLVALVTNNLYVPKSNTHDVISHNVKLQNPFAAELERASEKIERALEMRKHVSVFGRMDTGMLAVASLMEFPEIEHVLTYWSVFRGRFSRFESQGTEWLHENRDVLAPLLNKVTTVYTRNHGLAGNDTLQGAKVVNVDGGNTLTWKRGLDTLLSQPVELYINKTA